MLLMAGLPRAGGVTRLVRGAPAGASRRLLECRRSAHDGGEAGTVGEVLVVAGAVEVTSHGPDRDREPLGDLPVAQATRGQERDLPLPGRERQGPGGGRQGR